VGPYAISIHTRPDQPWALGLAATGGQGPSWTFCVFDLIQPGSQSIQFRFIQILKSFCTNRFIQVVMDCAVDPIRMGELGRGDGARAVD